MLVRIHKGRDQRLLSQLRPRRGAVLLGQRVAHVDDFAAVLNQVLANLIRPVNGEYGSMVDLHD